MNYLVSYWADNDPASEPHDYDCGSVEASGGRVILRRVTNGPRGKTSEELLTDVYLPSSVLVEVVYRKPGKPRIITSTEE